MKNRVSLALAILVGLANLLTTATSPATAVSSSARPAAAISCRAGAASLTVQHRAPVHTHARGSSSIAFVAAKGTTYRIGGYCINSAGNRWYCVAKCDFSDTITGLWVWEEYFRA